MNTSKRELREIFLVHAAVVALVCVFFLTSAATSLFSSEASLARREGMNEFTVTGVPYVQ